jgi:hypothetical protein
VQFGRAPFHILQKIVCSNPRLGAVYLSKINIVDGFYCIWIRAEDVAKLENIFPTGLNEELLVGLPLLLPMGRKQSPSMFVAATETVADLANNRLAMKSPSVEHRLDIVSETLPNPAPHFPVTRSGPASLPLPVTKSGPASLLLLRAHRPTPVKSWDFYVDNVIGMVQGNSKHRRHAKRVMMESLDLVLLLVDEDDIPYRQEPASLKNMKKGDATWSTCKVILGWLVDTLAMTVQLPLRRFLLLLELLDSITSSQSRTTVVKWQKMLGELRSMALMIPGGNGLFGVLTRKCSQGKRVRLTHPVHQVLEDFQCLAMD